MHLFLASTVYEFTKHCNEEVNLPESGIEFELKSQHAESIKCVVKFSTENGDQILINATEFRVGMVEGEIVVGDGKIPIMEGEFGNGLVSCM